MPKRLSQRAAELRAAGRLAYYDGLPMDACPHRLADGLKWKRGWRAAQLEVDALIERGVKRGVNARLGV